MRAVNEGCVRSLNASSGHPPLGVHRGRECSHRRKGSSDACIYVLGALVARAALLAGRSLWSAVLRTMGGAIGEFGCTYGPIGALRGATLMIPWESWSADVLVPYSLHIPRTLGRAEMSM